MDDVDSIPVLSNDDNGHPHAISNRQWLTTIILVQHHPMTVIMTTPISSTVLNGQWQPLPSPSPMLSMTMTTTALTPSSSTIQWWWQPHSQQWWWRWWRLPPCVDPTMMCQPPLALTMTATTTTSNATMTRTLPVSSTTTDNSNGSWKKCVGGCCSGPVVTSVDVQATILEWYL